MNDFVKELIERKEKINKMIENFEYINWLEEFSKKYNKFSDDSWLYSPSEIDKDDYDKVIMLGDFYDGLYRYAYEHYVDFFFEDTFAGENFWFVYNNVYYNIGYIAGQGTVFFIERSENKPDVICLNYVDAINKKYDDRVVKINEKFNELENYIKSFSELKVSDQIIHDKISKILDK